MNQIKIYIGVCDLDISRDIISNHLKYAFNMSEQSKCITVYKRIIHILKLPLNDFILYYDDYKTNTKHEIPKNDTICLHFIKQHTNKVYISKDNNLISGYFYITIRSNSIVHKYYSKYIHTPCEQNYIDYIHFKSRNIYQLIQQLKSTIIMSNTLVPQHNSFLDNEDLYLYYYNTINLLVIVYHMNMLQHFKYYDHILPRFHIIPLILNMCTTGRKIKNMSHHIIMCKEKNIPIIQTAIFSSIFAKKTNKMLCFKGIHDFLKPLYYI